MAEAWEEVQLPKALTSENGAKGLLIGEFYEEWPWTCHSCGGIGKDDTTEDGKDDVCLECNGQGRGHDRIPVAWTTIKAIYRKIVEHYTSNQIFK